MQGLVCGSNQPFLDSSQGLWNDIRVQFNLIVCVLSAEFCAAFSKSGAPGVNELPCLQQIALLWGGLGKFTFKSRKIWHELPTQKAVEKSR